MNKRLILAAPSVLLALLILFLSIFRTTGIEYVFSMEPKDENATDSASLATVEYPLPENLEVSPSDFFWPMKALDDKVEVMVTRNPLSKASLLLELADERLVAGFSVLENGEFEEGLQVLARSEEYLVEALEVAETREDAVDVVLKINASSLKHREVMEKVLILSPDDARVYVNAILDKTKLVYKESRVYLESHNSQAFPNPFETN